MADLTLSQIKAMDGTERLLYRDYAEDLQQHDDAIVDYDAYEAMDMGKTFDPVSRQTGNGLTDNMTATIYLERAARVAGQLPEGETKAFGKKDYGKGQFLDILRTNWIYPNANSQFDFLTKMFLWQYGSSEYNVIPMHYDINVNEATGYIGPDCWIWQPRNFIPQSGETSISDMDHVHGLAYKYASYFQDILDDDEDDTWDKEAIESVMEQIKNKTATADDKRRSLTYREKMAQSTRQVLLATRYEAGKEGHWITFLPDFGCKVIRNIKNPHKNGRIPFVLKRCIPKMDSYYGNGDFQRSMPMQFANDGLDNFYFQGIKINLFSPKAVNMQTAVPHTIVNEPGKIWEFNGSPDVKDVPQSNAGLSTYQAAKGMSKGALQSIAGTTDTRSNAENSSDPGFGKTPKALSMIQEREGTRDNFDRGMLERAMQELIDGFYSILPTISDEIPVDMFRQEIEEIIQSGATDLGEIFKHFEDEGHASYRMAESGNQIRIKIKPSAFKDITARFELKANSTAKQTREQQLQSMQDQLIFMGKLPNAFEQYKEATGKVPDWEFIFGEMGRLGGLPFMSKMFTDATMPPQPATPAGQEPLPNAPQAMPQPAMQPQAPLAPPVAPPMPGGMPPTMPPQPPPQPDPREVAMIQAASPENPVEIMGYQFTNPVTAMEAYEMALMAMAKSAPVAPQGVPQV